MKCDLRYPLVLGFAVPILLAKSECYGMSPAPQGGSGVPSLIGLALPAVFSIAVGIILGRILLNRLDMKQRRMVGAILSIVGIGLAVAGRTVLNSFGDVVSLLATLIGLALVIPGGILLFFKGKSA